jgi:addiction module RelE/StbE family toxin
MAGPVVWSDEAFGDLERIGRYIERDSPSYARALVRRILDSTRKLGSYPRIGRVVPELGDESFRELVVHSYRVMYRIDDDIVTIMAIAHSRQSLGL